MATDGSPSPSIRGQSRHRASTQGTTDPTHLPRLAPSSPITSPSHTTPFVDISIPTLSQITDSFFLQPEVTIKPSPQGIYTMVNVSPASYPSPWTSTIGTMGPDAACPDTPPSVGTPCRTSPLLGADKRPPTLDHLMFPHIMDAIFDAAPRASLLALRAASHEFATRVDARLAEHLMLHCTEDKIKVRSKSGRHPALTRSLKNIPNWGPWVRRQRTSRLVHNSSSRPPMQSNGMDVDEDNEGQDKRPVVRAAGSRTQISKDAIAMRRTDPLLFVIQNAYHIDVYCESDNNPDLEHLLSPSLLHVLKIHPFGNSGQTLMPPLLSPVAVARTVIGFTRFTPYWAPGRKDQFHMAALAPAVVGGTRRFVLNVDMCDIFDEIYGKKVDTSGLHIGTRTLDGCLCPSVRERIFIFTPGPPIRHVVTRYREPLGMFGNMLYDMVRQNDRATITLVGLEAWAWATFGFSEPDAEYDTLSYPGHRLERLEQYFRRAISLQWQHRFMTTNQRALPQEIAEMERAAKVALSAVTLLTWDEYKNIVGAKMWKHETQSQGRGQPLGRPAARRRA